jgi:hypothetical protein
LEALQELIFCTRPSNFGVEAYMKALAEVALRCNKEISWDDAQALVTVKWLSKLLSSYWSYISSP